MFLVLWTIAGVIVGWIAVEVWASLSKAKIPAIFNLASAFVFGLLAYTIMSGALK